LRLAVYTDYAYRRYQGGIYAERAFAIYLVELAQRLDRMVIIGRLSDRAGEPRYEIPKGIEFAPLPYYRTLANPLEVGSSTLRALAAFWRALDDVDAVWLFGPHPLSILFAGIAAIRSRRVFLGVRQDLPTYIRARHPRRVGYRLAATVLELTYRALARFCPTIVVGPALSAKYAGARTLLELTVSLVSADDVVDPDAALTRSYAGPLTVLSVGRLETEKNPLLMADVLAALRRNGRDWRLVVCGEGRLKDALAGRLSELGVAEHAELRGYVPFGDQMRELYRGSGFFLHVSLTEGLPQVLLEALAAGLPVVATDVGGVRAAVGELVSLVPPRDAAAAVAALRELEKDDSLRARRIPNGLRYVGDHTSEVEVERVAQFFERKTKACAPRKDDRSSVPGPTPETEC